MAKQKPKKTVEVLTHEESTRKNIPTAEYQSVMQKEEQSPVRVAYERRNRDLDPQLVWRGKDEQDWSDLVVHAPPLYIQEKVHPKVLIDDLLRRSERARAEKAATEPGFQPDLFADFNGLPDEARSTEFYQHDANWSNRMILGDSLQVMASLAEREGLRGQVQCIYIDPPYGIKFNSNFQWSTTSRDVKDGNADHITREPEQVKAFRDTWRDGIHSYLTYLRDRLTVARDLLTESGSIFVQIGDENVHRVRAVMDEVLGDDNVVAQIYFITTSGRQDDTIDRLGNYVIWFAKDRSRIKYRQLHAPKEDDGQEAASDLQSQGIRSTGSFEVRAFGNKYTPLPGNHWKAKEDGVRRLLAADRIKAMKSVIRYRRFSRTIFQCQSLVMFGRTRGAVQDRTRFTLCRPERAFRLAASSWSPTPATSCSTPPAVPALPPPSPNNGAGAGSRSTPREWRWRLLVPALWALDTPTTCLPTAVTGNARRLRSPAPSRPALQPAVVSARASSTSACPTSR